MSTPSLLLALPMCQNANLEWQPPKAASDLTPAENRQGYARLRGSMSMDIPLSAAEQPTRARTTMLSEMADWRRHNQGASRHGEKEEQME